MPRLPLALLAVLLAFPALAKPPRLTLFVSVDAMGSDVLLRSRGNLKGGLGQALTQGAFFPTVRYEQAAPVTATGHATLSTGANPWRHGVVANRVYNDATGKDEAVFADPDHPVLEAPPGDDDVSPLRLEAETLADRLRLSTRMEGKAIAVSGKARASIALAGRLGSAWWFNEVVGKFVTGTWYAKEFPAWVRAFNEKRPADALFGKTWSPLLPPKAYSGDDDRPWESDWYGMGKTFPHVLNGALSAPGPQYYKALASSPLMGDVIVQMAKAAIDGEQLGKDDVPDALFVGFSNVDRICHLYGPASWELQDAMLRLDRQVGELLAAAEKAAGKGNVLLVITADHGGASIPEEWSSAGLPAGRLSPATLQAELNGALKQQFGVEPVAYLDEVDVYLNERLLEQKKVDAARVREAAAAWLQRRAGISVAISRDALFTAVDRGGWLRPMRLGYFPGRSGDVIFVPREYHVVTGSLTGTSHGTPYAYDALVPLILVGRGVKPGSYREEVRATDVAPTVAALWEMVPPAMSEGQPLVRALNGR